MSACIFCKIASGEMQSQRVFEDDHAVVIRDLNPVAPTHLLVLPRKHIARL
ncbi:MAG: HIT domain-containing protein, partial [Elusimicrobia bacterium]|nr:HIT domain-containing protein [Elusimicrobiota bacterium]